MTIYLKQLVWLALFLAPQIVMAQFAIPVSVLGNGGDSMIGTSFKLTGTAGQAVVEHTFDTQWRLSSGFWTTRNGFVITDIEPEEEPIAQVFTLDQNMPNPFRAETTIAFSIPKTTHVTLEVFDMLGRHLVTLTDTSLPPGKHTVRWDGKTESGLSISAGTYLYRIQTDTYQSSKQLIFLR